MNILAAEIVGDGKGTHKSSHSSCKLPIQFALGVFLIGAVANGDSRDAPDDSVPDDHRVVSVLAQFLTILLQAVLDLLALGGGLLLCTVGRSGCLVGFGAGLVFEFMLDSFGLGLGLDGLVLEVRLDRIDMRRVDVDQAGGFGLGVGKRRDGSSAAGKPLSAIETHCIKLALGHTPKSTLAGGWYDKKMRD